VPITLNDLTVNFAHIDRAALLVDWQWMIGGHKLPILVTAMGTVFVQDTQDGRISLLDPGEGKLREIADSIEAFQQLLSDQEFVLTEFLVEDFASLRNGGTSLAPGQVFGFVQPPVLGGSFDVGNLEPTDVQIHFSLSGQIHQQVKNLPDGAPVSQVSIS
jgi:hypothetical protein